MIYKQWRIYFTKRGVNDSIVFDERVPELPRENAAIFLRNKRFPDLLLIDQHKDEPDKTVRLLAHYDIVITQIVEEP